MPVPADLKKERPGWRYLEKALMHKRILLKPWNPTEPSLDAVIDARKKYGPSVNLHRLHTGIVLDIDILTDVFNNQTIAISVLDYLMLMGQLF